VSEKLPSKEHALLVLRRSQCPKNVIKHCKAVAGLAVEIAKACRERGINVNVQLVEIGALLHDIGRSKTHTVHHAVIGAKIAESLGLPEKVISIIKRHVGGGITTEEAKKLRWPRDIYTPQTLEEKIVSYADKLIEGSRRVPIEKTIRKFSHEKELPPSAIDGMWRLHEEMLALIGDCECLP
jgi:uncharacterized protein